MLTTRVIKWGVIAALFALGCWLSFQWGESATRAEMAEARTEAVAQAREEERAKVREALERQRVRARAHVARIEKLQETVREKSRAVERYAQSESGRQQCFGEAGVEQWNAY